MQAGRGRLLSMWNQMAGGTGRGRNRRRKELADRAVELGKAGLRATEIARLLGVHESTVGGWLRRAGLGRRRKTRGTQRN